MFEGTLHEEPKGKGAATRRRIISAASAVIERVGLAKTTTKEIAREAGYSEATLYKHFRGKEDLVLAVMADWLRPFVMLVAHLPDQAGTSTVKAHLERLATQALEIYEEAIPLAMAVFAEQSLLERQRQLFLTGKGGPQKANELLTEYLRREQKLGRVAKNARVQVVADMLMGACFQRAYLVALLGSEVLGHSPGGYVKGIVREAMRLLTDN